MSYMVIMEARDVFKIKSTKLSNLLHVGAEKEGKVKCDSSVSSLGTWENVDASNFFNVKVEGSN